MNPAREPDFGTPASTSEETGANVVTTEYSDWATNCPEYKVTTVQGAPAVHRPKWQEGFERRAKEQERLAETT